MGVVTRENWLLEDLDLSLVYWHSGQKHWPEIQLKFASANKCNLIFPLTLVLLASLFTLKDIIQIGPRRFARDNFGLVFSKVCDLRERP